MKIFCKFYKMLAFNIMHVIFPIDNCGITYVNPFTELLCRKIFPFTQFAQSLTKYFHIYIIS